MIPQGIAHDLPDLGDSASSELSPLAEQRLGAQIMRDIRWKDAAYLRDPEVEDYLNWLGDRLVAAGPGAGKANTCSRITAMASSLRAGRVAGRIGAPTVMR